MPRKNKKPVSITGEYIKHVPREVQFEKTINELGVLPEKVDATLKNKVKRPGRPFRCEYPLDKKISFWIPEKIYTLLKNKSEKENEPMRKLIIDALMEQYDKELFGKED